MDLRKVSAAFNDAVDALNRLYSEARVGPAKDRISDCSKAVRAYGSFPTAVDLLQQAERAVVYPNDGVALNLVNQARAQVPGA